MNKFIKILLWVVFIGLVNFVGRYVLTVFSEIGYNFFQHFYIIIAGAVGTVSSLLLFFGVNFMITKKRNSKDYFSFTMNRLIIMFVVIILVYLGEQLYLIISDYFLLN